MTLRHLEIFRAVCRRGSATAAAADFGMTQPAVSIAIRELEAYYGTRLFDRLGKKLVLTSDGRTLLGCADTVLDSCEEAERRLRGGSGSPRCCLALNVSAAETLLPELLLGLMREIPGIEPSVSVNDARAVETLLADGAVDIDVDDSRPRSPELESFLLYDETMGLFCSPSYPCPDEVSAAELAGESLLLREEGSGSRACVDAVFMTRGLTVEPLAESVSDLCLISLARAGLGVAILPPAAANSELRQGLLRRLSLTDADFTRHYYAVYDRRRYLTPVMQKTIEYLRGRSGERTPQ